MCSSDLILIGRGLSGIYTSRLSDGMCDELIACDMIVGAGAPVLKTLRPGNTAAILNRDVAPTGDFQSNKHFDLGEQRMRDAIADALGDGPLFELNASQLAPDLPGDSHPHNILMLGYAAQKGLMPVTLASTAQHPQSVG